MHSYGSPADTSPSTHVLPTCGSTNGIPRISPATLHGLLKGHFDAHFTNLYVIDCRYDYEFEYGHISGALHAPTPHAVRDWFFPDIDQNAILVFHCELSHDRGPRLAAVLRQIDRQINKNRYPILFYPHVYILDGGYRQFYSTYMKECAGGYRPMQAAVFARTGEMARATREYREGLSDYERRWKHFPLEEIAACRLGTRPPGAEEREGARERARSLPHDVVPALCLWD